MQNFLAQILNGIAIGQIYALIALGFALVFGVANLINFAQGSLFLLGSYLSWTLMAAGVPLYAAAILSVLATALLSMVIEQWILRPLTGAAPMAMLLATLALAVIADEATELIWGADILAFLSPIADWRLQLGSAYISGGDILVSAVGLASTVALIWFLRSTWTGRALRASALDAEAAWQMGANVFRLRRLAFALAGALGAIAGILTSIYFQSVAPQMGLSFALKGFAAAIIGGAASIPGAVVGGIGLGVVEALGSGYLGEGYRDMIAYGALWLTLMLHPQGLFGAGTSRLADGGGTIPGSGASTASSSPRKRWILPAYGWPVLGVLLSLVPLFAPGGYVLHMLEIGLIFALLTVSITIVSGSLGYLSLGHGALFGIGAYTTAILAKAAVLPSFFVLLLAIALTSFVAVAIALTLLRVSGHTVALATLAIGQIGVLVFVNWIDLTRGPMGIAGIPAPIDTTQHAGAGTYWTVLAASIAGIWFAERLIASPIGNAWRAIREDRVAAEASGIPIRRYLLNGFFTSGALAGLAGGLFAYVQSVVTPDSFGIQTSITLVTGAVLGGLGNVSGAALAGSGLALLPEFSRSLQDYRMIFYGVMLLLALRLRPQGVLGVR